MDVGELVRRTREDAGLSQRALATRAGVPTSTVSRVETGTVDPTMTMLQRLLGAAGAHIDVTVHDMSGPCLAELADTANPKAPGGVDWVALRAFLDWLDRHPDQAAEAIADPPSRTAPLLDNLLAGIAEKVALDRGLPPPRWCAAVHPLAQRWVPPGTPRTLRPALKTAPGPLRNRNVWVSEQSLWRHGANA